MAFDEKELIKDAALWLADKIQESVTGFTMDWSKGEFAFKGSNIAWNLTSYARELSPGIVYIYDKNGVKRADGTLDDPYVEEYNEQHRQMKEADWKTLDEEIGRLFPELGPVKPWDILPNTNMCFREARAWRQPIDPLMLDLDGDGLELKHASGAILFDHNADTIRTGTGWIGSDDGILVRDLNGNGTIDSGRELFGIDTLTLSGEAGNDTLDGGAGNDMLYGGTGNNTYLFGRGDGQDKVRVTYDNTAGKLNTLRLKAGVAPGDIAIKQVYDDEMGGNTLELSIAGTNDKITLNGFFYGANPANAYNTLQQVQFEDGTSWDTAALLAKLYSGSDGNDSLVGTTGSDTIAGGLGNDSLSGGSGDDTLDGGAGNDTLNGGSGNDTYVFQRGSGQDSISDDDTAAGNSDIVSFGSDVSADQLWFRQSGYDLQVSIIGTDDRLTINNWYSGSAHHVEQFRTSNGQMLFDSQVQGLIQAMASFAPPAAGQTTLAPDVRDSLSPLLAASWGS
ncbi:hypothetical protein GCM10023165_25720 [Variovorax defluvii]|uniref:Haemolysin-type calcium binding-related domain-containing protein n=1 Tax=Variovorax defluvii TaxID=913761 RepID=A0ABP8HRT2_9BURK